METTGAAAGAAGAAATAGAAGAAGAAATAGAAGAAATAYAERCVRYAKERDTLARLGERLANIRLLTFVVFAGLLAWALWQPDALRWGLAVLLGVAFAVAVGYHRRVDRRRDRAARLWAINDEALARLDRRWDAVPLRHTQRADPAHPYARDLDLFGPGSLLHLIETPSSRAGSDTLAAWLAEGLAPSRPVTETAAGDSPGPPEGGGRWPSPGLSSGGRQGVPLAEEVVSRQGAVADLAPRLDLRQDLMLEAALLGDPAPDPRPFLEWAEAPPTLRPRPLLVWGARGAPLLLLLAFLASASGLVTFPLWLPAMGLNAYLHFRLSAVAQAAIDRLAASEGAFRAYATSLRLVADAPLVAPRLRRLKQRIEDGGQPAHVRLRRLYRLTGFSLPSTHMLYLPVQLLTLWNVHVLYALEGWQHASGRRARGWLATLGEVEALAALGGLAGDNPDWVFPAFDPAATSLDARALAHPLLPQGGRVANGVTVGPPGTFLLITGSNMAGKSTLLRAIGVNAVLAGIGAPVCALAFHLPPIVLWTSMWIEDSLRGGVSTFLAEARRIKAIVDAADVAGEARLLYLLDEPFRGTNARERRLAVRRVVARLVSLGALGAVATHDLDLADEPPLTGAARPVHFAETVVDGSAGPGMTFDYRSRPGLATTTNALRVLALVGLPTDEGPGSSADE